MHITQQTLSDIVVYNKYSKHIPSLKRRETWDEIVIRYATMMVEKYPDLANEIWVNARFLQEKKVLMSMRAAQFAGISAERNNSRIYNCAFLPIDNPAAFSEAMFLLLGGTGVGFSVQSFHVASINS
jgi:ribonucleoside-triphosphate reductase (thioredoxin)